MKESQQQMQIDELAAMVAHNKETLASIRAAMSNLEARMESAGEALIGKTPRMRSTEWASALQERTESPQTCAGSKTQCAEATGADSSPAQS